MLSQGNFRQVVQVTSKSESAIGHILNYGLARISTARRRDDIEKAMEESLMEVVPKLEKRTHYLATFANLATLLGLLGTIVGFIIMLAPLAGLDASDRTMLKSSMGLMTDGMAIAMYTTLTGLVGSILLRIQYYMLDTATARVFSEAVTLTETRVVPALERLHDR